MSLSGLPNSRGSLSTLVATEAFRARSGVKETESPFPGWGGEVLSLDPGLSGSGLESGQLVRVQLTASMRTQEEGMGKLPALPLAQPHPQETDMGRAHVRCRDLPPSHLILTAP